MYLGTVLTSTQSFLHSATSTAVLEEGEGMGDMGRRSPTIQQLSKFALSDSLREKVGNSLRKRSKPTDCEEETGSRKEEVRSKGSTGNSSSCAVVVKLGSTRAKRSERVGTRTKVVKSETLRSKVLKREEVQVPGLDVNQPGHERLDSSFYECDALELAPKLLGKLIRRDDVVLQITEVEAYRPDDSACHGRVGQTPRTAPLFGPAGHAYVYLCYGMHIMLNVVANSVGVGAAVLIRACSPVAGLCSIQQSGGKVLTSLTRSKQYTASQGPSYFEACASDRARKADSEDVDCYKKVGQALGLTTEWSTHPLYTSGGLEILDAPAPASILVGPRVGIDYAKPKDVAALWRFAIADNPWVSAPRSTLRLPQVQ